MKEALYHLSRHLCLGVLRGFFDFRFYGWENIPRSGAAILAGNHASFFDPPAMGAAVRRHVYFVARGTLAKSRLFAFFLWAYDVIRIRRGESDFQAVRSILERLKAGRVVGLFPEGTRSLDGQLGPFQEGTVLIARRARVPIVPLGIAGTFEAFPKGRRWPRRHPVRVVYGQPFDASSGTRDEANRELRRRIGLLLEEARSRKTV